MLKKVKHSRKQLKVKEKHTKKKVVLKKEAVLVLVLTNFCLCRSKKKS